jgi:large subunit ribosomal protein L5
MLPRLKERYREEVVPALMKEFGYKNVMQVPRLAKIVVNIGLGEAIQNPKALDSAGEDVAAITGQKPAPRSPSPISSCGLACPSA